MSEPPPQTLGDAVASPKKKRLESAGDEDEMINAESEPVGLVQGDQDDEPATGKEANPISRPGSNGNKEVKREPSANGADKKSSTAPITSVGGAVKKVASGSVGGVRRALGESQYGQHMQETCIKGPKLDGFEVMFFPRSYSFRLSSR